MTLALETKPAKARKIAKGVKTVAPWLAKGTPIRVPADEAKLAWASRRFPAKDIPARTDLKAVRESLRARIGNCQPDQAYTDPHLWPLLESTWRRLVAEHAPADADEAAVMLAIACCVGPVVQPYFDALVERDGLPAVVDLVLHRLRGKYDVYLSTQVSLKEKVSPWHGDAVPATLRRHLSVAPEAVYRQCVENIRTALPTLAGPYQLIVALMLPDERDIADDLLAAARSRLQDYPNVRMLAAVVSDPTEVVTLTKERGLNLGRWQFPTMVQERGIDLAPHLASMLAPNSVLAWFAVPEAIAELARRARKPAERKVFAAAVKRSPLAAIAGLANMMGEGSRDALVQSTLLTLLEDHADALPGLRPWLGENAQAAIDRLQRKTAEAADSVEFASPEELPPVLARPPWLQSRKRTERAPIVIDPLPREPRDAWDPEERRRAATLSDWKAKQYADGDSAALMANFHYRWISSNDIHGTGPGINAIRDADAPAFVAFWQQRQAARTGGVTLDPIALTFLPGEMGVQVWNALATEVSTGYDFEGVTYLLAHAGHPAVPGLVAMAQRGAAAPLKLLQHFGTVEVAATMARHHTRLKWHRELATQWLLKFPEHTACALIADAIGAPGEARDCAGSALRLLAANGHAALVREVAVRYGRDEVTAAVDAVLAEDPLDRYPAKPTPLPIFWQPRQWRRPVLAHGPGAGKALSDDALDAFGTMLGFPSGEGEYAGIDQVRQACTPDSLEAFMVDCFGAWIQAGSPSRGNWALFALADFGNDEAARKLVPHIRGWIPMRQNQAFDILIAIGSDVALMLLNNLAQRGGHEGMQARADAKLLKVANERGLTITELRDRLVPDLGLDARGTTTLDFGPRSFQVTFDESLAPCVRDSEGARLADLPKPKKSDDAALAKAASERYKGLKKDVRTIASQQLYRLERAMCERRRWSVDEFETYLARHPLLRHLVQRLVWAVYAVDAGGDPAGTLASTFRITEDGSAVDARDEPFALPAHDARVRIGIVHPLEPDAATLAAFGQVFADYELLQPFPQLARDTCVLATQELSTCVLERWKDRVIPTGRILGLSGKGWNRGSPGDGGWITSCHKAAGSGLWFELDFGDGILVQNPGEVATQTLGDVRIVRNVQNDAAPRFADLHPIDASELIRDMQILTA